MSSIINSMTWSWFGGGGGGGGGCGCGCGCGCCCCCCCCRCCFLYPHSRFSPDFSPQVCYAVFVSSLGIKLAWETSGDSESCCQTSSGNAGSCLLILLFFGKERWMELLGYVASFFYGERWTELFINGERWTELFILPGSYVHLHCFTTLEPIYCLEKCNSQNSSSKLTFSICGKWQVFFACGRKTMKTRGLYLKV